MLVHVFFVCLLCIVTAVSSRVVGAGMVVDWEQETGLLMTSGDVRVIRIWDTDREMKVQVLIMHRAHLSLFFFLKKILGSSNAFCSHLLAGWKLTIQVFTVCY